ncbi:GDSL esterase/lipase At1g58430 [Capsella rubella]|uniref:GDSL esterase/lipase At1g58430 n=1 Tax=Capsella rubella TaxID=81985 RepID=UPI000CD54510|nr:GDSL esterase/lipase At1g58430 [Capsella rubella]
MSTSITIAFTLFITTTLLVFANAKSQPLFPAILIFGDSTVDTGNNNYPSEIIFKAKHVPYGIDFPSHSPNGRFSNGKIFSDIIATKLNIKQFVPPFLQPNLTDQEILTGVCFASAGAGYDDRTSLSTQAIRVSEQPNMLKSYIARLKSIVGDKKAMKIINNAFVVVSAGPNDFILNYYDVPSWRREYPTISDYQEFVLNMLNNFVRELYSLGCRKFLVGGLPPMGCLPIQMTAQFRNVLRFCLEQENRDSVLYNQKLQKLLPQIEGSLTESKILYSNVYDPMMDMIQRPSKYGFKETTRGCCGSGYLETSFMCNAYSTMCQNRSEFMFFDSIHPTEAGYSYIANVLDTKIRGWLKA